MEQAGPPIYRARTPEAAPPPPERPRRNLLERLGLRTPEAAPKPAEKAAAERAAEKTVETATPQPEIKQRVGERLLAAVGVTPKEKLAEEPEVVVEPQAEKPAPTPEKPALERAVEGARSLGGNVLRLLNRAREIVTAADSNEPQLDPTDIRPLDKAERKVSDALDELDDATTEAADSGGDYAPMPEWQLRAAQEAAAANAWREAELQIEAEARRREKRLAMQQVGALALGALVVAGGSAVYSWRKIRKLRREHERMEKRDARQEAALRKSEERIEELERNNGDGMDRQDRQEYVGEVSKFATVQAEQIREVAEDVREQQGSVVRPLNPEKLSAEIKKTPVDRVGELVSTSATKTRDAMNGGIVGAGGVVDFLSGKVIQPLKNAIGKQPAKTVPHRVMHDPIQTWLNGVLLILGILLVLALALAVL